MVMSRLALLAAVIRLNPVPWLFAPGVALAGWLMDGMSGAGKAAATVWVILRRRFTADESDTRP
jgi:hypothetical protein